MNGLWYEGETLDFIFAKKEDSMILFNSFFETKDYQIIYGKLQKAVDQVSGRRGKNFEQENWFLK